MVRVYLMYSTSMPPEPIDSHLAVCFVSVWFPSATLVGVTPSPPCIDSTYAADLLTVFSHL
jgi:hypothetical protein